MIKELKKFIRYHIANSKIGVILFNAKDINEPIIKAVDDLSRTIQGKRNDIVNPESISDPIVEAQKETTGAIKEIPETDLSILENKLDALIKALKEKDLSVEIGKTKVDVDTKSVVKSIQKLEKSLDKLTPKEATDYTLMMDEIMKILEKPQDQTEIIKTQELIKKLATSDDLAVLADWLNIIAVKEYPEFPELPVEDGRVLVSVDKVGGGGGGLTAIETDYLKTISEQDPLAKYKIADKDDDAEPNYFGFTDISGNWYILKEESSTYRYATGTTNYATAWSNRATESYDYLYNVTL